MQSNYNKVNFLPNTHYKQPMVMRCLSQVQSLTSLRFLKKFCYSCIMLLILNHVTMRLNYILHSHFRLHHVGKLPWQHTWLSVSLHLSKLGDLPEYFKPQLVVTSGTIESAVSELALFVLCLLVTKIVIFDQKGDMSFSVVSVCSVNP